MTQHGRVPVGYGARAALLLAIVVGSVAKAWAVHSFVFVAPDVSGIAVDSAMLVAVLLIASWPADDLAATIWTTIASALIAAWLVATAVYAHYFAQLLTFHTALREGGNAAQVVSLLPDLLMKRHGLLFADTVVFGALALVIGIARRRVPDRRTRASLPLRVTVGALAVAVVTASTIYAGASSPSADHLLLAQRRGILPSQIVSSMPARRYQLPPVPANLDPSDPAALTSALDEIIGPAGTESPERLRVPDGTNVIIVVFEGLQTMAVGASIDGEPVTPALTALRDESLYFPATFSQVGKGNTSDAEFTLNTGWYSPPGLAPSLFFADRELPGLPRTLSARGYTTSTFHANDASFWNRDELYPALGFQHVYDRDFFGTEDMYLGWGVHDEDLLGATLPLIVDLHAEDEPFLAEIVTLSSHAPFSPTPAAQQPIALPQRYRNTTAGDYVTAIHYADEQLGVFVESLEEAGVLDDTLLVVVGDHGGLMPKDTGAQTLARDTRERAYYAPDYLNVPLIIRPPGGADPVVSPQTVGHVDLPATILNALGVADGFASLGRDATVPHDALLPTRGRVPMGSYVATDHFLLAGLTQDEDVTFDLPAIDEAPDADDTNVLRERAALLMGISKGYLEALPPRNR